tara:strand:+ start:2530 stop:3504 length:975 start_codon:yes stop_codon:yes gene_type:complete
MEKVNNIKLDEVRETIKKNYSTCQLMFMEIQSSFLIDIYKRYNKDLDGANIVLYFAKNLHRQILHQRENDLKYDISLENFWMNHKEISQPDYKIINISKDVSLPKETTRRKINTLLRHKVLQKKGKKLFWHPTEDQKKSYESIVKKEISDVSKMINCISSLLNIKVTHDKIKEELNKHYSFYWFHYLSAFLKWAIRWQKKSNDLEIVLIALQCAIQTGYFIKKKNISSFSDHYSKKISSKVNFSEANISATSISEITGIPRATCIRKLEKLVILKVLKKHKPSKRYYFDIENVPDNSFMAKELSQATIDIFSDFYLVIIKGLIN